jgi:ribosomal protein S18 acetylase RimI-like enzyme
MPQRIVMADSATHLHADIPVRIRSFRAEDLPACRQLYVEGLLGGKLAENDTGVDIHDIEQAYMRTDGNMFWVAETIPIPDSKPGEIVGMIGVQQFQRGKGEIRRLRVREDMRRRGIGSKLIEVALKFCQDRGFIKIELDTFMEREPAVKLFEKFHFRHDKSRVVAGKEMMYFYLDLYSTDRPPASG